MSLTTIQLGEARNWGGLSIRELARRTWRAIDEHNTIDQAALVAFYAMLSFVPLLGFVLALSASAGIVAEVPSLSAGLLPPAAETILHEQVQKIQADQPAGLLSLSAVLLLWSASSLFVAVMDTINTAYGTRDTRPWWQKRLLATALTVIEAILLVGASASIALWPEVARLLGLGGAVRVLSILANWVVVLVALLAAFALAYRFGPHLKQEWEWITPGGCLGVLALIAISLGFRLYVLYGPNYSATYGALAGVILMMLWFYFAALALLVGAEVNSVIEHAALERPEKVSG